MKRICFFTLLLIITIANCYADNALLAFPDAKGWGRFAEGGRRGKVYHVTNLNDSGSGSLRDAVSSPNRIVIFDVAGVIRINSRIVFSKNLYVAGQTAPGEGITVYGDGVSFTSADNIIVRYMRFRMGAVGTKDKDCAGIAGGKNMIFDHCSFSWGQDETFSINASGGAEMHNFTLSNCIFGQGLMSHSAGGLMQGDSITLYRNFYCDNNTRNNKVKGRNQYVNNVVYNWNNGAYIMGGDSQGESFCNIVGNLFVNGPAGGGNAFSTGNTNFHCYVEDNIQDSDKDGIYNPKAVTSFAGSDVVSQPYKYPVLEAWPAIALVDRLIPTVGASLPYRDLADYYMVDEFHSFGKKGELISNEKNLFIGTPETWSMWKGNKRTDSDGDGMPDDWEKENGTNPAKDDAMVISDNGYVNIENYINSITAEDREFFLRTPVQLEQESTSKTSMVITWHDYTEGEEGFAIEVDGKEIARTESMDKDYESRHFEITGLQPNKSYNIRIRAYKGTQYSEYTPTANYKTLPEGANIIDVDNFQADAIWTKDVTNWTIGGTGWTGTESYQNGQNVLFDLTNEDSQSSILNHININDLISPGAVVVRGEGSIAFEGNGAISGDTTSVNKGGNGTLIINTLNSYNGATALHGGTLEFNTLKNGGVSSAIGASSEFAQNWLMDGGTYRYTGESTTTNRSARLMKETTFSIAKNATVTMNGRIEDTGNSANFIVDGKGQITVGTANFFGYTGKTILKGGTLYLSKPEISNNGIGESSKLVLAGGTLKTAGESATYETYSFPIEIADSITSYFSPNRNCYISSKVTGGGTLQFNIPYLREYIQGDWSEFTGTLIANAATKGNLFLLNKQKSIPNGVVVLKNGACAAGWDTNGEYTLGGLSGDTGTELRGSSKQTDGFNTIWTIGSANTNETFNGVINNYSCSGSGHTGTVNIVKVGTGDWALSGTNDYKGKTTVKGGRLIINGKHTGKGIITVTDSAALGGKGTLAGQVSVNKGATIFAGDGNNVSGNKLTLSAKLTVANSNIQIPVKATDLAIITNSIALNGGATLTNATLTIDETASEIQLKPNTMLRVFTIGTTKPTGSIVEVYPKKYIWDTSTLLTSGILKVVTLRGDANGDDEINVNDITYLADIILTGEEYTEAADANADGIINVNDITTIAKMILQ